MKKLLAKDLKNKFIDKLTPLKDFYYEDGNPFMIRIGLKEYYVFLKNISPAYFKNSPDITRVQLPYSIHFKRIFESITPFIIFGYDLEQDVVVVWDPIKVKNRLNTKSNISLYSRISLQKEVSTDEFRYGYLTNNDQILLFKSKMLPEYFLKIASKLTYSNLGNSMSENSHDLSLDYKKTKLQKIFDKGLLEKIEPYLYKNQVLRAVELTIEYYSDVYKNMSFKDWFKLVNDLHKEKLK